MLASERVARALGRHRMIVVEPGDVADQPTLGRPAGHQNRAVVATGQGVGLTVKRQTPFAFLGSVAILARRGEDRPDVGLEVDLSRGGGRQTRVVGKGG